MAHRTTGDIQSSGAAIPGEEAPKPRGLPRYYPITALVVLILFVAAGGFITYRLSVNALVDGVTSQDAAFAQQANGTASQAVALDRSIPQFEQAAKAEMAARSVARIRIFGKQGRIVFSTDTSEIGQYPPGTPRYWVDNSPTSQLNHVASFGSGQNALKDRDIITTTSALRSDTYAGRGGLEISTDVTADLQKIAANDALVAGGIVVVLLGLLGVVIWVPRKS